MQHRLNRHSTGPGTHSRPLFLALLLFASLAAPLAAQETPQATTHRDSVWVNTASGVYHCPGTRYFGTTRAGQFMTETAARAAGHRPPYGRPCSTQAAAAPTPPQQPSADAAAPAAGRVWVNTSSGVYHCPGTRYYGATRQGRYMTESEARSSKYRPAFGRACS